MAEYYCNEHKAEYFKKGKMKGYAHPLGDGWCNMPEGTEPAEPALVTEAKNLGAVEDTQMTKDDWADKDTRTRTSIERQTSLNAAKDIAVAKISKGVEMTVEKTIAVAKEFAKYLDTGT